MGVIFVSGNLAMDYVGTLHERFAARAEQLRAPGDLGRWLVAAGLLDTAPGVSAAQLDEAVGLRETMFAVIAREIDGRGGPTADERAQINAAASHAPPVPVLSADARVAHVGDLAAGLSAVARDAIALFERTDGSVLKWCADDACTHPFLDRSRGHRRRWCDMGGCGDRAKAAAYRARQRQSATPTGTA